MKKSEGGTGISFCLECKYALMDAGEYHPYWYCVLHKNGMLQRAKLDISKRERLARIDEIKRLAYDEVTPWIDMSMGDVQERIDELQQELEVSDRH